MKQKLSMNLEDVHNPENDEERSYNHIRAWVRDDLRGTYDARLALSRLLAERRVLGEKKAGMQRKIERSTECLRLMKAFDGSLDSDNDAPMYDLEESDLEYDETADLASKALTKAEKKHAALLANSSMIDDRLIALTSEIGKAKYAVRVAEKAHDETWLSVRKISSTDKKPTSLRTFLATEHGAQYFRHLSKYTDYYRLLPEARANWMMKHLMDSWGGVS